MGDPGRTLLDSTRRLADTALGLLQTRIQLLATELEEEKTKLLSALAFGAAALILLILGVVFLALTLTVVFWDQNPVLVLGLFTAGFVLAGSFAAVLALRNAKASGRVLSATIEELKHDRIALRSQDE